MKPHVKSITWKTIPQHTPQKIYLQLSQLVSQISMLFLFTNVPDKSYNRYEFMIRNVTQNDGVPVAISITNSQHTMLSRCYHRHHHIAHNLKASGHHQTMSGNNALGRKFYICLGMRLYICIRCPCQ